jgi:hypothetical protein
MNKKVQLTDSIKVPTQREFTDSGQMIVPCAFARTGSQMYTAGSLGIQDQEPNELVEVFRDEADVFAEDTMSSFRSAPVTIGHPSVMVDSENAAELQVGMLEGMPTRDEELVTGTLVIQRQDAIDLIEDGVEELSAGYTCDLEVVDEDGTQKIYQRNIRANHIAIVAKGRAGSACSIADEAEELVEEPDTKVEDETAEATPVVDEVVEPEAETVAEAVVTQDAMDVVQAKLDDALEAIKTHDQAMTDAKQLFEDTLESLVELRVLAADMCEADLKGLDAPGIRKAVVVDKFPSLDLEDKSDAYIEARFDMLLEDDSHTPMGDLLKKQAAKPVVEDKAVDPVVEARQRSIARNKV